MAVSSEVRDYIAKVRARGYKVVKTGKHYKILYGGGSKYGQQVVDENGPLIISSSPSDMRWREMHVRRAMAVGIFADDPYKETRGKKDVGTNGDGADEDDPKRRQRAALAAAAKARGDENRQRSRELRARIEMMIVKLGGWNTGHGTSVNGVTVADFMRVLHHWLDEHQTEIKWPEDKGIPTSPAAASQALSNLRKPDSTLGSKWLPVFEAFLDFLYAEDAHDSAKAATRYRILVRETRGEVKTGISTRSSPIVEPGAGLARVEPEEDEPENEPGVIDVRELRAARDGDEPSLALKALYFMARAPDAGEGVIEIARQIAELEMAEKRTGRVR